MGVIASRAEPHLLDRPGGVLVRRIEQMSEEDKVLMQTVSRVIVSDTGGTLADQADRRAGAESAVPAFSPSRNRRAETPAPVDVRASLTSLPAGRLPFRSLCGPIQCSTFH
jgi:hypothetical protein